jgi:hypothetical protein
MLRDKVARCCEGVCDPRSGVCDDGNPTDPPIVRDISVYFCQEGEQNCASSSKSGAS